MSVPTAQLRNLQLSGNMPPHTRSMSDPVHERAIISRDILSSFQRDCLPSEYRPDVFQGITNRTSIERDIRYHVTQGDLEASEFRLGAYNPQFFSALRMLQSDDTLSLIYCDKLVRRFEAMFTSYDELDPTSTDLDPNGEVTKIIAKFREDYQDAVRDRNQRRARVRAPNPTLSHSIDRRFASMLIIQLRALCKRSRVPDERAHQRRRVSSSQRAQGSPRTPSYLFQQILGNASSQSGFFALDILESCSAESLERLQPDQDGQAGLRGLQVLLRDNGASHAYQDRFANLVTEEEEEE